MKKELQKELLEILENKGGNLYDFVANNYWEMSKEDLKDLALEIIDLFLSQNPYSEALEELLENIKEYRPHLVEEED